MSAVSLATLIAQLPLFCGRAMALGTALGELQGVVDARGRPRPDLERVVVASRLQSARGAAVEQEHGVVDLRCRRGRIRHGLSDLGGARSQLRQRRAPSSGGEGCPGAAIAAIDQRSMSQGSSGGGGDIAVAGARRGPAHGRPRGSLLASSVGASMLEVKPRYRERLLKLQIALRQNRSERADRFSVFRWTPQDLPWGCRSSQSLPADIHQIPIGDSSSFGMPIAAEPPTKRQKADGYICTESTALAESVEDTVAQIRLQVSCVKLGSGSYGAVYRGVLERTKPQFTEEVVAVKAVCMRDREAPTDFETRTRHEALKMTLPDLKSEFIIRLLHRFPSGRASHCQLLAMRLAMFDLHQVMSDPALRDTLHDLDLVGVVQDVLTGLTLMHERGYVHRDIKPQNILLNWDGAKSRHRAIIADMDFLCDVRARAGDMLHCSGVPGTPWFLSPEVWRHLEDADADYAEDPKRDVFATGLTFLGLSGSRWSAAFDAAYDSDRSRVPALIYRMASHAHDRLQYQGPLAKVLARMLHPEPRRRCTARQSLLDLSFVPRFVPTYFPDIGWGLGYPWPETL